MLCDTGSRSGLPRIEAEEAETKFLLIIRREILRQNNNLNSNNFEHEDVITCFANVANVAVLLMFVVWLQMFIIIIVSLSFLFSVLVFLSIHLNRLGHLSLGAVFQKV